MLFISFSCLITLSRTSSTVFGRSDESGNPWLVLDLRRKTFKFFTIRCDVNCFCMCLCLCVWMAFLILEKFSYVSCFQRFFKKSGLDVGFCQMLFLWLLRLSYVFFVFSYVLCNIVNYIDWILNVKITLHSLEKSHIVLIYYRFNILLVLIC